MIVEIGHRYTTTNPKNNSVFLWHCHGRSPVDGKFIMEYIGPYTAHGVYMFDEAYCNLVYGPLVPVPYDTKPVQ